MRLPGEPAGDTCAFDDTHLKNGKKATVTVARAYLFAFIRYQTAAPWTAVAVR